MRHFRHICLGKSPAGWTNMVSRNATLLSLGLSAIFVSSAYTASAQRDLSGLMWRNLGPFRGGRVASVGGAIGQPGVFYMGMPQGGIWKTTSAGVTWFPVFDSVPNVCSVGAVAV